jgi:hypothetical protein
MATINETSHKTFLQTFLLVVIYAFAFYALQVFLNTSAIVPVMPDVKNICGYDSNWYKSIAEQGYVYSPYGNNTAFYFLFSLIWKFSHLGTWGICVLNVFLFATGFSVLCSFFELSLTDKLLWLSVPCMYFCFIPYTEALFFLLSALCLLGIIKDKVWLIWVSLFFLSLTRATAVFFIPAFLCMELAANTRQTWYKSLGRYVVRYLLPILIGTAVFVLYQYWKTKVWFAYYIQQTYFWERKFAWPSFPLTGLAGDQRLIWLSALSLFIGFTAFVILFWYMIRWLVKNKMADKLFLLSLGYLTMSLVSIVFFNPCWGSGTTNVIGANRYTMVNPFLFIFIYHLTKNINYTWVHFLVVVVASTLFGFFFGSYKHIDNVLFFSSGTVFVVLYMLYANKKLSWPVLVLTAFNLFLQIHLFQQYLGGIMTD